MTPTDTLFAAGIKAAVISIDLTERIPVWRVALSEDGATCGDMRYEPMVGSGLSLEVAIQKALAVKHG